MVIKNLMIKLRKIGMISDQKKTSEQLPTTYNEGAPSCKLVYKPQELVRYKCYKPHPLVIQHS